jgi:hypothetical protein
MKHPFELEISELSSADLHMEAIGNDEAEKVSGGSWFSSPDYFTNSGGVALPVDIMTISSPLLGETGEKKSGEEKKNVYNYEKITTYKESTSYSL